MNPSNKKKTTALKFWFWCILALLAGYHFLPPTLLFDKLDREVARTGRRLGESITHREGLHFLVNFDGRHPVEIISNTSLLQSGVKLDVGRHGNARYFDGRGRTFIATESNWGELPDRFSIGMWIKIDERRPDQKIVYAAAHGGEIGLRLLDGDIKFHVPGDNHVVSYEFGRYGEFVHIAAVADAQEGYATIYENGREMARVAVQNVDPPNHNITFSMNRWSHSHTPFLGIIDEVAIRNRALGADEVKALSERSRGLQPRPHLGRQALAVLYTGLSKSIRTIYDLADAFNLFLHPGHASGADLPELNIYLSNSDLRYFLRADSLSAATGYLVSEAAKPKDIEYYYNGERGSGELQLYSGSLNQSKRRARMGFLLASDGDSPAFGIDKVRLSPAEDANLLEPLFATEMASTLGLPHVANGLVRLNINGEFRGVYYFEDYRSMGFFPEQGAPFYMGTNDPRDWKSLFREAEAPYVSLAPIDTRNSMPMDRSSMLKIYEELVSRCERPLINDHFSPLSSRETRHRIRRFREELTEHYRPIRDGKSKLEAVIGQLQSSSLIANNPSTFFIVENLDLDVFDLPDITIDWRSENPEVLRDDGTIIRPRGQSVPQDAYLTAIVSDGVSTEEKRLRFRVMPEIIDVPVAMLYAQEPLGRRRRVDAFVRYYETGSNGIDPLKLTATEHARGGLSHRGNTSHWDYKKPLNLRCDEPHGLLNDTDTKHLFFAPGTRDETRLRNRLSFELFRSFSTPASPRHAPELDWVEVFFNGEYIGLYEMTSRIDRHVLGFPSYSDDPEQPAYIFNELDQKYPTSRRGDYSQHYMDMRRALGARSEGSEAFDVLAEHIDIDNAIDHHLLLNIIEGDDNTHSNYYLVRRPGEDEKYEYVVWDMKRTFGGRDRYYAHHLSRHASKSDEFRRRLKERWSAARQSHASKETLLSQVDSWGSRLTPYMRGNSKDGASTRGPVTRNICKLCVTTFRGDMILSKNAMGAERTLANSVVDETLICPATEGSILDSTY